MRLFLPVFISLFLLDANIVKAQEPYNYVTINGLDGRPFFNINIANEGSEVGFAGQTHTSAFTLNNDQVNSIRNGMEYWVTVLDKHKNTTLIPEISLFTIADTELNASAGSVDSPGNTGMTVFGDMIVGNVDYNEPTALIDINNYPSWATGDLSSLPQNGDEPNLSAVLMHELGHALGILASTSGEGVNTVFTNNLNLWTQGLRKDGAPSVAPVAGGRVNNFLAQEDNEDTEGLYFTGGNVVDVLDTAKLGYSDGINATSSGNQLLMPGIPVNTWEGDDPEFSHIELQNSLMSHQSYRNWGILMEAELAIMQDIGYDIDRRNFYGHSIYTSNGDVTNTEPYFARNADGTDFIAGEYNATPWGIGLHIYGSGNDAITQAADILSSGIYGIGIRVDGVNNILIINPNTKVHANGAGGNALAVTYGKDHNIVHRGDLTAEGLGGVAARFDFGDNASGNTTEYRGSWLWTQNGTKVNSPLLPALAGSLVNSFDVTGSLIGNAAAIYIADNAHVANINIMNGTFISGDIISDWNPASDLLNTTSVNSEDLLTNLSFGLRADSNGEAILITADQNFSLHYNDNIDGQESIRMSVEGGELTFNGEAQLLTAHVKANATLAGTGRYEVGLTSETYTGVNKDFENEGTLLTYNPSNLFDMSGVYIEAENFVSTTGKLSVLVNGTGDVGGLTLAGNAANQNETFASLSVSPAQDYYDSGNINIDLASAVTNVGTVTYTDTNIDFLPPVTLPTLNFAVSGQTDASPQLSVTRVANAYSQYASSGASQAPASILNTITAQAGVVQGDMRQLIGAIDFSDASTASTALQQLSSAAYQSVGQSTIQSQHVTNGAFVRHMLTPSNRQTNSATNSSAPASGDVGNNLRAFASVVGIKADQNNTSSVSGYSASSIALIGGVERDFDTGLMAGINLAIQHKQLNSDNADDARIKTDGISIGVHALFKPVDWNGAYIVGQLRGGLELNNMNRTINFNNYNRRNSSNWTDYTVSSTLGGGWDNVYENMIFGPVAWLDYSALIRPAFTENGGGDSRLHYDNSTLHSLRSSLGGRFAVQHTLEKSQTPLQADLLLVWQHELLDSYGNSQVGFANYTDFAVSQKNAVYNRDSLFVQLGAQATLTDASTLRFQIGSEFFSEGYSSVMGNVSFNWAF